jgi:hypothetical protein
MCDGLEVRMWDLHACDIRLAVWRKKKLLLGVMVDRGYGVATKEVLDGDNECLLATKDMLVSRCLTGGPSCPW